MNEETIFAAALEKKSTTQRQAFLDEVCSGQPELRSAVEGLLLADAAAGSFMEHPPVGVEATVVSDAACRETLNSSDWAASLRFLEPCDKPDRIGLLDQYEIIEVVGHGGMGAVMRAFDPKLSRVVAVKTMSPGLATNATAVKRFLREATTAASIHHDHVVTIHAVNDSHVPPYLVMQFIEGRTLQQKIDHEGALGLKHILRIGSQAAAGLAAAHKLGVIHRDVKPANILLENGVERVKISDFGLARAADDMQMTQTGIIAGTPQYMSPEQAKGEPIDARSDLFSLGSVLYTMCTGRPAFRADNPVAVLRRVCDDTPRPIREINAEIPAWLEAIVNKLLAKDPNDRFQTASEVAELLGQHLAHEQNPANAPRPPEIVNLRSTPETSATKSSRSISQPAILAAAAAILLLIGLSFSEAAGVTNVAATIIRIATGEGTLVIEADDPNVKVAINGEEVTIHGTGVEEVRLRPGSYKLAATKDGQPVTVDQELVKISRGGKQIVRVAVEHANAVAAVWQPPENPDPSKILQEAQEDMKARRYEMALAKHVWYHENALRYRRELVGVRLSFALSAWKQLADVYPPALTKLKSVRDETLANVKSGSHGLSEFMDFVGINQVFGDDANTRDAFLWLHEHNPDQARIAYIMCQPALIKTKDYKLCNSYLDPEVSIERLTSAFRINKRMADDKKTYGNNFRDYAEKTFSNGSATLVALLAVNERQAEAAKVAEQVKKEWDNASFHAQIDKTLAGEVPQPWPPREDASGSAAKIAKTATAKVNAWQPPEKPDPHTILQEAHADTKARRFETALAKHVWYHEHALEIQPAQTGVRVSFALSYWGELCENYPPALEKLKAVRDEAVTNVKEGRKVRQSFQDLAAINRTLGEEDVTRDVFAFLHAFHAEDAKVIFTIAEPCLIRAKAYQLCNTYLEPEQAYRQLARSFQGDRQRSKSGSKTYTASHLRDFTEPFFTNKTTTLVALLVVNDRKAEAEQIAADAKKEWEDPKFHTKLDDALKGNVPEPWPPGPPAIQRRKTAAGSDSSSTTAILSAANAPSPPKTASAEATNVQAGEPGWVQLFNGQDLTGWQTLQQQPGNWNVKDGILVAEGGISHLFSEKTYGDFHLRAEVRLLKGDSGISFRSEFALPNYSQRTGLRYPGGYEADIADPQVEHSPGNTGTVRPLKPVMQDLAPMGEWFTFEVIAQDNHFVTKINGQVAADVVDPDRRAMSGRLALGCGHSAAKTAVEFRKIEIKELSSVLPESPQN